ncbi:MAG: HAMP domain-containing histidine kinase [Kiritimatiellae bacterium]|nr:HAMP domain-containing histidine kinase [Kiritimatiellia bacterium]
MNKASQSTLRGEKKETVPDGPVDPVQCMSEWARDIRHPLTMAKGFLYLLGRQLGTQGVVSATHEPAINENLQRIEQSLNRCTEMTEALSQGAQTNSKAMGRVSLNRILLELADTFSAWAKYKGVDVWIVLASEEVCVKGVRIQLARAMQNLLINAVDAFLGCTGEVTMNLQRDQDLAVVRVMDNGRGMSAEIWPHAFEPQFTRGKAEGCGLGLGIVKRIVQEHGGCVELASQPGIGTSIVLRFPLCAPP